MTTSDLSVQPEDTAAAKPAAADTHQAGHEADTQVNPLADPAQPCPCGSGKTYGECCLPYHNGTLWPDDPQAMMRSRYSAYVTHCWDYLTKSDWQEDGEEEVSEERLAEAAASVEWLGLNVLGSGREEDYDYVDYTATYRVDGQTLQIAEHAHFRVIDGKLCYTGGEELVREPVRRDQPKVGRNDPCPCGSGKKYKKCCGKNA